MGAYTVNYTVVSAPSNLAQANNRKFNIITVYSVAGSLRGTQWPNPASSDPYSVLSILPKARHTVDFPSIMN